MLLLAHPQTRLRHQVPERLQLRQLFLLPQQMRLHLLLHHLAGDHTTPEVMQEEKQAHLLGQEEQLPELQPFRNLVAQARLGVSQEEHEEFFRKLLGDVEEPTAPFGLLDVQGDGTGIEEAELLLDSKLARRIRERARKLRVSAASVCHVAWAQVLARVSGREDVIFGTVLFGRMQGGAGADRVMGLFINTLPVRIRIGEESVEASVRRTHEQLAELLRHEHASLALAQRCSRVPAPLPLFSALLNYRHSGGAARASSKEAERAWAGMEWVRGEERTNYPFTLSVGDLGEGFRLTVQTLVSINAKRVCEFMRTALEGLIEALETAPARAVGRVEVLPEAERDRVLYEWNDTAVAYPKEKCIQEVFEEQVEKNPEAVAVVYEEEQLTYGELNRRANRLGHYLRELGVRPDGRVGICVERSLEMVVGLLGILKAGGAYVPLDPGYPEERLRYMLEDSSPTVVLTQGHLMKLFSGLSESIPVIDLAEAAEWGEHPEINLQRAAVGLISKHLAYVIYTSGSTGMPKGVMVEHANVTNYLLWADDAYYHRAGSGSPAIHSIGFDGIVTTFFGPIIAGQTLALLPQGTEMEALARLSSPETVPFTLVKVTPSHLKLLNRAFSASQHSAPTRILMIGGEALVPSDVLFWQQRFPDVRLVNHFGPTETTVGCCTFEISEPIAELHSIPIGRPIANTRIYILDTYGEPVPVGVAGELYIGGAGVARGYLNRPELTAEKFVKDPFAAEAGARMYKTGDLGRWLPDGNIEFLGRNDDQVKIRGYRIELGEIEARLAEHAGVREAVVLAREDEPGEKRLVAYYTPTDTNEGSLGAEELRSHLSSKLPEYMVPAAYVRLERMPLTANGKLNRKGLPAPEGDAYAVREYEAPRGETEKKLAEIWAELLKVERVGRQDNFFELGGHSLLAVRMVSRIRQVLGVEAAVRDLFTHPILNDFARNLEGAVQTKLPPIVGVERSERLLLSFAQQRLWFLAQMEGGSEAYHIPFGLHVRGELNRAALRRALERIVVRHEALRTTFASVDGEAVQRIASIEESHFHLVEHDLRRESDVQ